MQTRLPHRRAFTLIELTVSLAVTSILLVAIGSAMVLASRAVPNGKGATGAVLDAGDSLARLTSDLQHARYVAERRPHAITFTVADRDDDGSPERIRYAWSGNEGDPLTRRYNEQPAIEVVTDVRQFRLQYHTATQTAEYPGPPRESTEQLLGYTTSLLGLGTDRAEISSEQRIAQTVTPDLPADAIGWRPTRVKFRAGAVGTLDGEFRVQLRPAGVSRVPESRVLEQTLVSETLFSALGLTWEQAGFSNAPTIKAGAPTALVFEHQAGSGVVGHIEYYEDTRAGGMSFGDENDEWDVGEDDRLRYYLYGNVIERGATRQQQRTRLSAVEVTLDNAGASDDAMNTRVALLNAPEVLAGYWRADFAHDPTRLDVNADQQADWRASSGFEASALVDGVWHVDRSIYGQPLGALTRPHELRLRFRYAGDDGGGAVTWLYMDRADGEVGSLAPFLQRRSDGTQTLTMYTQSDAHGTEVLTSIHGLPAGFVDLRLWVEPASELVNVRVNGVDRGTFHYKRRDAAAGNGVLALYGWGSYARYDYAELNVTEAP